MTARLLAERNPRHQEDEIWTWRKTIPNAVTLTGSFVGISSIYWALQGRFDLSVLSIVFSGLIDGLDGPIARFLRATSQFGAELDSLSDYVCFGVSPALVLYLWGKANGFPASSPLSWLACTIYALFVQCRLARFNAGVDFNTQPFAKTYFMGVPAPGGAGMVLMPIVFQYQFGQGPWLNPTYVVVYQIFVGVLAFSRLPTFSSKLLKRSMFQPIWVKALVLFGGLLFFYGIFAAPWLTLIVVYVTYVATWPWSWVVFRRLEREANAEAEAAKAKSTPTNSSPRTTPVKRGRSPRKEKSPAPAAAASPKRAGRSRKSVA